MPIVKTAGIFFINKEGKLLVAHPTGHDPNFWSIPKGKLEEGESSIDAALRETYEETNVDLGLFTKIYELDEIRYKNGKKKLKPFIIFEDENSKIDSLTFDLKCNSIVGPDSKWNNGKPEMDGFKWVSVDEAIDLLHPTQVQVLGVIKDLIIEKNGERSEREETEGN